MLKETTINDKSNSKVIAKLYQGHFKVKIETKLWKYQLFIKFNTVSGAINYNKDWFWDIIGQTYFPHTFQDIEGSVNPGRGITPLFPSLHSMLYWTSKIAACSSVKH